MRRFRWLVVVFVCCFSTFGVGSRSFSPDVSPFALPIGTVVLDAGHGGHDPGAIATYNLEGAVILQEKEIVLDIMMQVSALLRQRFSDLTVLATRAEDRYISLEDRSALAAQTNPGVGRSTLFVSIHANSAIGNEATGMELLIKQTDTQVRFLDHQVPNWAMSRFASHTNGELNRLLNRENLLLATYVEEALVTQFPSIRDRGIKEQDVWVLNASKVPSVLVEIGFISNLDEALLMLEESWRSEMAEAIAQGIVNYINRD